MLAVCSYLSRMVCTLAAQVSPPENSKQFRLTAMVLEAIVLPRPSPNNLAFASIALARRGSVLCAGGLDGSMVTMSFKPEHEVLP